MALIKCVDCGKEVSDKAESCPNCGHPIECSEGDAPISQQDSVLYTDVHLDEFELESKKRALIISGIVVLILILAFVIFLPKSKSDNVDYYGSYNNENNSGYSSVYSN